MSVKTSNFIEERLSKSLNKDKTGKISRLFASFSLALGSMALIISLSVLEGFDSKLHETAINFTAHISASSIQGKNLPNYQELVQKIKEDMPGDIKSIEAILISNTLLKSKNGTDALAAKSAYTNGELGMIKKFVIEGQNSFVQQVKSNSNSIIKQVIISKNTSEKLNLKLNDKFVFYSLKQDFKSANDAKTVIAKVIGIYHTGMMQYDDKIMFMSYQDLAQITNTNPNETSNLEIYLNNPNKAEIISARLEQISTFPYFFQTFNDFNRNMFEWIELQKKPIPIILTLISIVASLNILTSLLIMSIEKVNTIGILRTLGMSSKEIRKIMFISGFKLGAKSLAIGMSVALSLCFIQINFNIIKLDASIYFLDSVPIKPQLLHVLIVFTVSMILTLLATSIPAFIAGRLSPLKSIKFK